MELMITNGKSNGTFDLRKLNKDLINKAVSVPPY